MKTTEDRPETTTQATPSTTQDCPDCELKAQKKPEPTPPPVLDLPAGAELHGRVPFELWGSHLKVPPLDVKCAAALNQWATGRELTREEFEAGVERLRRTTFRRNTPQVRAIRRRPPSGR